MKRAPRPVGAPAGANSAVVIGTRVDRGTARSRLPPLLQGAGTGGVFL